MNSNLFLTQRHNTKRPLSSHDFSPSLKLQTYLNLDSDYHYSRPGFVTREESELTADTKHQNFSTRVIPTSVQLQKQRKYLITRANPKRTISSPGPNILLPENQVVKSAKTQVQTAFGSKENSLEHIAGQIQQPLYKLRTRTNGKVGNLNFFPPKIHQSTVTQPQASGSQDQSFKVSTELAAKVVKDYLLPMFESTGFHRARTTQISSSSTQALAAEAIDDKNKTIHSDLKITVRLQKELTKAKKDIQRLQEDKDSCEAEISRWQKQVKTLKSQNLNLRQTVSTLTSQMKCRDAQFRKVEVQLEQSEVSYAQSFQFAVGLQKQIGELQSEAAKSNAQLQSHQARVYKLLALSRCQESENLFLKQRYADLMVSLDNINQSFKIGELQRLSIQRLHDTNSKQGELIAKMQVDIGNIQIEKNQFRDEVHTVQTQLQKTLSQKSKMVFDFGVQKEKLLNENQKLQVRSDQLHERVLKLDAQYRSALRERDRLRTKLTRVSNAKKQSFIMAKTCVNCKQEFSDTDNFNWSCRTHPSEWGGKIWWCCGKTDKNTPGCKFDKHHSKEDAEEPDEDPGNPDAPAHKLTRCHCCKQLGHATLNCDQDPNLKTTLNISEDEIRVLNVVSHKQMHIDSAVSTTHLFKKVVMVPTHQSGTEQKSTHKRSQSQQMPFSRGIMNFDDYNYSALNKYVLIEAPQKIDSKQPRDIEEEIQLRLGLGNKRKEASRSSRMSKRDVELFDEQLSEGHSFFVKDALQVPQAEADKQPDPDQSSVQSDQLKRACTQTRAQEESEESGESPIQRQSLKNENQEETPQYNIYFSREDIAQIEQCQKHDIFKDILTQKMDARRPITENAITLLTTEPKEDPNSKFKLKRTKASVFEKPPVEVAVSSDDSDSFSSLTSNEQRLVEEDILLDDIKDLIFESSQLRPNPKKSNS